MQDTLLEIRDLDLSAGKIPVLSSLSLSLRNGETAVLLGESGAGKTMLLRAVIGLLPYNAEISRGSVLYSSRELLALSPQEREHMRGREISMVSQNPSSSFNPVYKVSHHFRILSEKSGKDMDYLYGILSHFSLYDIRRILDSYPDELSGGMLQRLSIAAALMMEPRLLLLDEPASALDATVADDVCSFLKKYRKDHGLSMLLVTHDLGIAASIADSVAVMHKGAIAEHADVMQFFRSPLHPYSRSLLTAANIQSASN